MNNTHKKFRIAIFISGSGTNAEAICEYFVDHPTIEVALILSNNEFAYGLERTKKFGITAKTFNREQFRESNQVMDWLAEAHITHVVLAGFLWLIPLTLVRYFPHKIINIHPALLPKFGGKGMYGMKVHEAVKQAEETETGITIHEVNEKYDEGKILFQARCKILPTDSPAHIADKVHSLEHLHYPHIIEVWIKGT